MPKQRANAAERRAASARLLLRLLVVIAALSVPTLVASAAYAEQPEPVGLTNTNPPSSSFQPAQSTTPRIIGRGDGAITSAIRTRIVRPFPITADINPDNVVDIYTNSSCSGAPVATGDVEQLEGEGIQVEVVPDVPTTFYAIQTEAGEPMPSDCSKPGLTYWHSSTPVTPPSEPPSGETPTGGTPAPAGAGSPSAPRLRTVPGGRANHNTPLVTGSTAGAATVRIFDNPSCSGTPVAKGSPGEFATGLQVQVGDNTVTIFSGISGVGGEQSVCSAPVTYIEDSAAPRTRITMGPGVKTRRRKAVFRFTDTSGDPPGTAFLCKVDHHKWKQCRSPFKLRHLGFRPHILRVRGIDLAGNAEAKGAKRSFKVVRSP